MKSKPGNMIWPLLLRGATGNCPSPHFVYHLYRQLAWLFCQYTSNKKYADDTSIQGLIKTDEDVDNYFITLNNFVNWCDRHFLKLHVKKTKQLIFNF